MKKKILFIFMLLFSDLFIFSETLVLKSILYDVSTSNFPSFLFCRYFDNETLIFNDSKFISKYENLDYINSYDYYINSYNINSHECHFICEVKNVLFNTFFLADENYGVYVYSTEFDFSNKNFVNSYQKLNLEDFSMEPIQNVEFSARKSDNEKIPAYLKNANIDEYFMHGAFGEYYYAIKDMRNRTCLSDPYKTHVYYDMDLVLYNKNGNVCAILPLMFDDCSGANWNNIEVSPNGKYLKVYTRVNEDIEVKHKEFKNWYLTYIYEIVPDSEAEGYLTEVIKFPATKDVLKLKKSFKIKPKKVDYSDFNVKISNYIDKATCIDSRVRIRKEPNLQCETLGYLDKDENILITERSDNKFIIDNEEYYWYKIETSTKQIGWVYGKYLDTETEKNKRSLEEFRKKYNIK